MIKKLLMQIVPSDRETVNKIILNEFENYVPLKHDKKLLQPIWKLSQYITKYQIICFSYSLQDKIKSKKIIKPVSIIELSQIVQTVQKTYGR